MIYTITLNPALDYTIDIKKLILNKINTSENEYILPGGKGINVSIILKRLEIESIALGFISGFTGREIKRLVENENVKTDFINIKKGNSRINVKILEENNETAINTTGPLVHNQDIENLYKKLDILTKNDILVLSGSIPKGISEDIYEAICARVQEKKVKIVVDATKDLLLKTLKYKPFLIKPNHHELGEMFNVELKNKEEIIIYAKKLQEIGARNVIISMAGDGAILIEENGEITISDTPKGTLVNSVGAGDSMVGGFLAGIAEDKNIKEAFKMGVATGSASAFSEGLATKDKVEELLKQL